MIGNIHILNEIKMKQKKKLDKKELKNVGDGYVLIMFLTFLFFIASFFLILNSIYFVTGFAEIDNFGKFILFIIMKYLAPGYTILLCIAGLGGLLNRYKKDKKLESKLKK